MRDRPEMAERMIERLARLLRRTLDSAAAQEVTLAEELASLQPYLDIEQARLDPARFVRVHRSRLVNVARVIELEPLFQGEYVLRLRDGRRLTTGRTCRERVRRAFGLRSDP